MKKGFSNSDIEELSYIVEAYTKAIDLKTIYDAAYHTVLNDTAIAKLSIPIRYCMECQEVYHTDRIFCEKCGFNFIKRCDFCGITENQISNIQRNGGCIRCDKRCKCPTSTPNDTISLHGASVEGFICSLHEHGFTDSCCSSLSSVILLSEYAKEEKGITSAVTMNLAELLKHFGKDKVAEIVEQNLNSQIQTSKDALHDFNIENSNISSPEELLYCVECTDNIFFQYS